VRVRAIPIPNSHFDIGVGLRGRGRYPLKPRIFASLLETKGEPRMHCATSNNGGHTIQRVP